MRPSSSVCSGSVYGTSPAQLSLDAGVNVPPTDAAHGEGPSGRKGAGSGGSKVDTVSSGGPLLTHVSGCSSVLTKSSGLSEKVGRLGMRGLSTSRARFCDGAGGDTCGSGRSPTDASSYRISLWCPTSI